MRPAFHIVSRVLLAVLLATLPAAAQQAPPAEGDEAELIAVLQSDAELFDKAKACQTLAMIGTAEAVPALAELLADPQLGHYARFALEPIPDGAVDEALREALADLEGGLLVGVINSIGMRRDQGAVEILQGLLDGEDDSVADAALAALGRIASTEAVATLITALATDEPCRAVADAALTAGDMLVEDGHPDAAVEVYQAVADANLAPYYELAALHHLIRYQGEQGLALLVDLLQDEDAARFRVALAMSHELASPEIAQALIDAFEDLPQNRQVLVVHVLGDLDEPVALPTVLQLADSAEPELRLPAVQVLASLGDGAAVPVLLQAAVDSDGTLASAAQESLADLAGEDVDAELAQQLETSEGAQQRVLINLIGLRQIESAVPQLQQLADADDPELRTAAINALGLTVNLEQLPALIERLVRPSTPAMAEAAKTALNTAVQRMPDRERTSNLLLDRFEDASTEAKAHLLDLLGAVGDQRALQGVAQAAREGTDPVQDAATRVLGEWMSADAAPVLLELAQDGPPRFRVRTLRGYLRIARQLDVSTDERVAMARRALDVAQRDAEKELALEILGRYPTAQGLELAAGYLDDDDLKAPAAAAAIAIAEKIVDAHPEPVARAMPQAAAATSDEELKQKANQLLQRAQR